jgi:SAM-dependent methyltransferase
MKDVSWMIRSLLEEDPAVASTGGGGAAVTGDALSLPFDAETFDRVIAAEVLEHIPDDRSAIEELSRVLRPGGTMAVTVPRWWPELLTWALSDDYHNTPGGHIRIYRLSVLARRMQAAGLEPYGSHHAHALHAPYWWLRALVGVKDENHPAVRLYHRLLVWDITAHTPVTRLPEAVLNPVLGKSAVLYLRKS